MKNWIRDWWLTWTVIGAIVVAGLSIGKMSAAPPFDNATPTVVETQAAKPLTRKQQRELGLLPRQVMRGTIALAKAGDITPDMTASEMAFVYAASVTVAPEYAGAWNQVSAGEYGADWDSIIEFLERLMELLVKFLPLIIDIFA